MASAPPAKKAKTEEEKDKVEEQEDTQMPTELELDAPTDKSAKVKDPCTFPTQDMTMNCLPAAYGSMLMPLTDGGLQYLLAGARANVGLKSGRYMFEAKIVEVMNPAEDPAAKSKAVMPQSQLRVGFATGGSTLFLGESDDSISFDNDGAFVSMREKTTLSQKFGSGDVVAVLLNLDKASPNSNTISLFKNGERACEPQKLPDSLQGKTLFPTLTFRNLSVFYNFGATTPVVPLPFACRMVNEASAKDAALATVAAKPKDGKYEVLFPVFLPDEGAFDWLEEFMREHPDYTELSDRAILDWAEKSGVKRASKTQTSRDSPEMSFGISMLDDGSVRRVLNSIAPIQQRNYVCMEVKTSLLKEDRKGLYAKWASSGFKRTAAVMIGEPPAAIKKKGQDFALKEKQETSDADFKAKQEDAKRKKVLEKTKKKMDKDRLKAQKLNLKRSAELKKKIDLSRKKKEAEAKGEEFVEEAEETQEPEEEEDEEQEAQEDEEMAETEPPTVELTNEEKKQWFRKPVIGDLTPYALSTNFTKFSVPEKEDGLDEVKFEWQKGDKCNEYVRRWIQDRKCTTRIEDLQPSEWFTAKWKDWQKTLQSWHAKQNARKQELIKKAADKASKAASKEAKKRGKELLAKKAVHDKKVAAELKKQKEEEAKTKAELAGEIYVEPVDVVELEEEEKKVEEIESDEEKEEPQFDFENADIFAVEDILDVGGGEPLFANFAFEDWTMMSLRFELHLLAHAFRKDVNDADRPGMILEHLPFYYTKYFKKALNTKFYGVETMAEILNYLRDTILTSGKNALVEPLLTDEMESFGIFVMLTEECRRDRNRRIDMGEDSAKLKFVQPGVAGMSNVFTANTMRPAMPNAAVAAVRPVTIPAMTAIRPAGAVWPATRPAAGMGMPQIRPAAAVYQPVVRPGFNPMWRGFGR